MNASAAGAVTGWFGKIPSKADFVMRGLPSDFVSRWDLWLKAGLSSSRAQLGATWLDCYLATPVWRFALSNDVCGSAAWIGVMIPSVDSAGRFFPMTVSRPLPAPLGEVLPAVTASDWFCAAQALLLATLDEGFDYAEFDHGIAGLPQDSAGFHGTSTAVDRALRAGGLYLGHSAQMTIGAVATVADRADEPYSLWWTTGGDDFEPATLACWPLPPESGFAAMLCGRWDDFGWSIRG